MLLADPDGFIVSTILISLKGQSASVATNKNHL